VSAIAIDDKPGDEVKETGRETEGKEKEPGRRGRKSA
jgi:hypothetical protein